MKFQYLRCRSNDYKILLEREKGKFHMILMKFDIGNSLYEPLYHISVGIPEQTEDTPKTPNLYLKHVIRYLNLSSDT